MSKVQQWQSMAASKLRSPWFYLVVLTAVITVVLAANGQDSEPEPLDPDSVAETGTKALVLVWEELGVDVKFSTTTVGSTAVLLRDDLTSEQRDNVRIWVERGGTLVVADPSSPLGPAEPSASPESTLPTRLGPQCGAVWTEGVAAIEPGEGYALFPATAGAEGCFSVDNAGSFAVATEVGRGTIVQLGSPALFTNAQINQSDNAVLLANLIGAGDGTTITWLQPDQSVLTAQDDKALIDLIPVQLQQAFLQLILACIVFALWRGRRLGPLVHERQPVELPASALVLAVGELLAQAGQTTSAAAILRRDLRRRLAALMGTSPTLSPELLAQLIAARTGLDELRLRDAIIDAPVSNGEELLLLSQKIETVHREVAHVR